MNTSALAVPSPLPKTVSQLMIPSHDFWGPLPPKEVDATVSSRLESHVSFNEITEACSEAGNLIVVESHGETLIGLRSDEVVMPGGWLSLDDFLSEHFYQWVVIPKEGCTVEYVDVDRCGGEATILPRLKELEPGRESDPSGLLFAIVDALGLVRAHLDMREYVVTYY